MRAGRVVVLIDLDDTLFDHHRATRAALSSIHGRDRRLSTWSFDELERQHRELLETLHLSVLAGRASIDEARIERFRRLLSAASPEDGGSGAEALAMHYRHAYLAASHPVAGARDLLAAIRDRDGLVVIVTNNQVQEQRQKLHQLDLSPFVSLLVTSEETGSCKPDARIFHAALERAGAGTDEAVMFGDSWMTDIEGALRAGVRAVWFNRFGARRPVATVPEVDALEPTERVLGLLFGE
jgi:putative hydrolase of the HAD superfamily